MWDDKLGANEETHIQVLEEKLEVDILDLLV